MNILTMIQNPNPKLFLLLFLLIIIFLIVSFLFIRLKTIISIKCDHIKVIGEPKMTDHYLILRDGYKLNYKKNIVENSKRIFILFHGLSGNIQDLEFLQKRIIKKNDSVINLDQRNWGKNQITNCYHFETMKNDYFDCFKIIKKNYSKKEIVFLGHSLGTLILSLLIDEPTFNFDKKVKFILVNYPNIYQVRSLTFIRKKNLFFFTILKGFFLNKKINLKILNFKGMRKFDYLDIKKLENFFIIRKIPFYFFANLGISMFFFRKKLLNNKKNKIYIFNSEFDEFANKKRKINNQKKFEKFNKNIKTIEIKGMHHRFFMDEIKRDELLDLIYSEIKK